MKTYVILRCVLCAGRKPTPATGKRKRVPSGATTCSSGEEALLFGGKSEEIVRVIHLDTAEHSKRNRNSKIRGEPLRLQRTSSMPYVIHMASCLRLVAETAAV